MGQLKTAIEKILYSNEIKKSDFVDTLQAIASDGGYEIVERNDEKPWGAYLRIANSQADLFIKEFFPGLTPDQARLGNHTAELSPKFLVVQAGHRLSWQLHDRRAERWVFLTPGGYHKSTTDEQGELIVANEGDVIQFQKGERHRLVGSEESYTLVAEIWQHVDPRLPSDEDDITRLSDDYSR